MALHRFSLVCGFGLVLVLAACNTDPDVSTTTCGAGELRPCTCSNGKKSMQSCGMNHEFSVCQCGDVAAPDGGEAGAAGGAAGSTAGAGAGAGGTAGSDDDAGMTEMAGSGGASGASGSGGGAGAAGSTAGKPAWSTCADTSECDGTDICEKAASAAKGFCSPTCTMMNDCPTAPSSGTATKQCGTVAIPMQCFLACPLLTTCPTGMTCDIGTGTCVPM